MKILGQLRLRNQRENGGFTDLINSRKTSGIRPARPVWFDSIAVATNLSMLSPCSSYCFSDSKLLDQVESLRKEITRLDYHKNELEKVRALISQKKNKSKSFEIFSKWKRWKEPAHQGKWLAIFTVMYIWVPMLSSRASGGGGQGDGASSREAGRLKKKVCP